MNSNSSNSYNSNNMVTSWERLQQAQRQAYYQIDRNVYLDKQYSNGSLGRASSSNSIGATYSRSSSSMSNLFPTVEVGSTQTVATEPKPSASPASPSVPPSSSQPSSHPSSTPKETIEEPENIEEKNEDESSENEDEPSENEDEELTEVVSELTSSGLLEKKKTIFTSESLEQEMNRKIEEFKRLQRARNDLIRQLGENAAHSAVFLCDGFDSIGRSHSFR